MATYEHTTVSGHDLAFDVDAKTKAFLVRLASMVDDSKAKVADMIALGYGSENPFLDHSMFPGRGAVTPEILKLDAYTVMSDLIYRKEVAVRGVDLEAVAAQYTMSVAEAANALGMHPSAIKQAITARRIGAWKKGGKLYLNPGALASLTSPTGGRHGPKARPEGPAAKPSGPGRKPAGPGENPAALDITFGSHDGLVLKVRGPGELEDVEKVSPGVQRGRFTDWSQVVVFIKGNTSGRTFVLERADERNVISFGPFSVEGHFDVTMKVNSGKRAAEVFREIDVA